VNKREVFCFYLSRPNKQIGCDRSEFANHWNTYQAGYPLFERSISNKITQHTLFNFLKKWI